MKKNSKNILAKAFILVSLICFSFISAFCEEVYVNIGLYFGSSARDEYKVSADNLFIGRDYGFFFNTDAEKITVSKDSLWHIEYSTHESIEDAENIILSIKEMGLDAFPVIENGEIKVYGGSFLNENDALWASENLAVQGTVKSPKEGFLCAKDENGNICFISDRILIGSDEGKVNFTAVATKEYRGMMLFLIKEEKISAINYVEREEYLYSVISREMSPSWHKEALKAQAVCARNYVENNRGKHDKYGFDLCDSVCCQAYAGTSSETEGSYPPVLETKDEVLVYDGKVAQTFYSSSMGPKTEDVKYVWGSSFPYLSSVENPYEDYENVYNGKWEKTLTKKRATEIMEQKGYKVGTVTEIKALEFSPNGRVIKLLVKGTSGEKIFERESTRIVFSEVTPSQYYTISGGGEARYPSLSIKGKDTLANKNSNQVTVLSASGKTALSDKFFVLSKGGKSAYSVSKSGDDYVFSGYGWGHGIGMSQYGAKGMAEAGFTYDEILTHYFKGTEIEIR